MKVVGLDGKSYNWKLQGNNSRATCSDLHKQARVILYDMFPCDIILEEVSLPGSSGLRCDFYLPTKRIMIEVHGVQHYERNSFFHKHITKFVRSNQRDNRKAEWCELNGITLIELPYNRTEEWKEIISKR